MAKPDKPVSRTNRMGKTYYLHAATTKKGATRYVMKTTRAGALDAVPDGMEIVEGPNGEVSARKIQAREINPLEIQLIEAKLAALGLRGYRVAEKGPHLTVYEPWRSAGDLQELADSLNGARMSELSILSRMFPDGNPFLDSARESVPRAELGRSDSRIDEMLDTSRVEPVLRFTLEDKAKRMFSVDRMTYRGSGGWHSLSWKMSLQKAAETYLKHLGKESFFELM
jgi:hypothetical protein